MVYRVRIKNLLNKEFLRRTDDTIELSKRPGEPRTDFFVKMSKTKKREKEASIYEHVRNKKARYVIFDKDKNKLVYQNEPSPFTFVYRQNVFNIKSGNSECLHVDANQQIRLEKCNDRSQNQKFTLQVLKKNSRVAKNLKNNERMMVEVEGKDFKKKDKKIHEDNVYIKYDDDKENSSDDKEDTSDELADNFKTDKDKKGDYKVSQEILTDTEEEPAILKTDHVSKVLHSTLYTTVIVNKTSTVFSTVYHTSTSSIIGNKTDLVTIDPSYTAELKPVRQVRPKTDEELTAVANIDDNDNNNNKIKKKNKFNKITNMFKKPFKWSKNRKDEDNNVERHENDVKGLQNNVFGYNNERPYNNENKFSNERSHNNENKFSKKRPYNNENRFSIERSQNDSTEYLKNKTSHNQSSDSSEHHFCDDLDIKECRDLNLKSNSPNNIFYKGEPRQDFNFKRKKQFKHPEKENVKLRDDIMLQYFEEPRISDFIDDIPDMDLKTFIGREKNTFYKNDNKNNKVDSTPNVQKNNKIIIDQPGTNKQAKVNFSRFDPPVEPKNIKKTDAKNQNKIVNQKRNINSNNSERGGLLSYVGFDGSIGDDFVDSSDDELLGGLRLNL